jgi:hypothetical protein
MGPGAEYTGDCKSSMEGTQDSQTSHEKSLLADEILVSTLTAEVGPNTRVAVKPPYHELNAVNRN